MREYLNHCEGSSFYLATKKGHTSHVGAYCDKCNKWLKWVGKNQIDLLVKKGIKVQQYKPSKRTNVSGVEFLNGVAAKKELMSSKGCKYCCQGQEFQNGGQVYITIEGKLGTLTIFDKEGYLEASTFRIKYCPMCASKLPIS